MRAYFCCFSRCSIIALSSAINPLSEVVDMTRRTFTVRSVGPGVVAWFIRSLAKVTRAFGPSKDIPTAVEQKYSGACGLSTNTSWALGSVPVVMIQGTPSGGVWESLDGGQSWRRIGGPETPNVRVKSSPEARRRARAVENVAHRRPGPVARRWGSAGTRS